MDDLKAQPRCRMWSRAALRLRVIATAARINRHVVVDNVFALRHVQRLEAVFQGHEVLKPGQLRMVVREFARRARIEFDAMTPPNMANTPIRTELYAWRECLSELESASLADEDAFADACLAYMLASSQLREMNDKLRLAAIRKRFPTAPGDSG